MTPPIEPILQTALPPAGWESYVEQHPRATAYHSARWITAVADLFGLQTYFLARLDTSGVITGVLPLVRQKSLLFGDRLTSLPFFNYGGALADTPDIQVALMESAAALCTEVGAQQVEIRDVDPAPVPWPQRRDKATLLLDLPPTVDALGKQLGSKLRSQVRRAQREQPQSEFGGIALLDEFFTVFAEVMRDLGTPVYPRRFFQAFLEHCGDQCTVVVLRLDGVPVSSAFLVSFRDRLEIPWAGTVAAVKSRSVNMALYWEVLRHAVERGTKVFDFGRSTIDSGPYRFKLQWGAKPVPLHWATWTPRGLGKTAHSAGGTGGARKFMTRAWSHLPLAVANRLGPMLSPNLPW